VTTIALYDVDSKIPNLALMKISAYHKSLGHEVVPYMPLMQSTYDKIYASTIFKFSDKSLLDPKIMEIGGTGWDLKTVLPDEIETFEPDYSFYDYPHNMGFTMRGCRFRCKFCVVPQKEGKHNTPMTIEQLWQQRDSNFIMLLDNDFFGNPDWRERIDEMVSNKLRISFSQGLNIRLIDEEQANALASVDYRSMKNKHKVVHFAWDQFGAGTEKVIMRGMQYCFDAGIKPSHMAFYVLIGFNTTPEEDLYRVEKLRSFGCDPYVMPFNKEDRYQRNFARWVNHKATFKTVAWQDYEPNIKFNNETLKWKEFQNA
jgi:hypothetical protein